MRRRDKSNRLNTVFQVMDYLIDYTLRVRFRDRGFVPADLVILAKHALHVAMGKEYVAYTLRTRDNRLFTVVGHNPGNVHPGPCAAVPQLTGRAAGTAHSRAQGTFFEGIDVLSAFNQGHEYS